MKKIILILIALMIMLSSCSVLKENDKVLELKNKKNYFSEPLNYLNYLTYLYYVDSGTGQIVSTNSEIEVSEWRDIIVTLIDILLSKKVNSSFRYNTENFSIDEAFICGNVANISITTDLYYNERQKYYLSLLIADTIAKNMDVEYTNITINDETLKVGKKNVGLLTLESGIIADIYDGLYEKNAESEENYVNLAFYYKAENSKYIFPEVQSVNINGSNTDSIVDMLYILSGQSNYHDSESVFVNRSVMGKIKDADSSYNADEFFNYYNGTLIINNAAQVFMFRDNNENIYSYMASIYYTLKQILPELKRINFTWPNSVTSITTESAKNYLGREIKIYLPCEDRNTLDMITRKISSYDSFDTDTILTLLSDGVEKGDPSYVTDAFPLSLSASDMIDYYLDGDCIILNFSEQFVYSLERLDSKSRVLLVYSIVNSLCEIKPVKRVLFLVNGKTIEPVEGEINLETPLLPNIGIVRK